MRLRHGVLLAAVVALPALGVACNGILGIGAPTLLVEASTDAPPPPDGTLPNDSGPMTDAAADGIRPPLDGSMDAPDVFSLPDEGAPAFDGNCLCPDASCDPVTLVSEQANPQRIAVDPTGVYWANFDPSTGSIWHTTLDGRNTKQLAAAQGPVGIVAGGGFVYWVDQIGHDVEKCALPSCNVQVLDTSLVSPKGAALSADTLFVANELGHTVNAYSVLNGSLTIFAGDAGAPYTIATDATNVYWTGAGAVFACPLAGCGAGSTVIAASPSPLFVATNGTTVFWVDGNLNVYSIPVTGGPVRTVFKAPTLPTGIAVDATHVYLAARIGLLRTDLDGTNAVTLAAVGAPRDVALAGNCAYWLDDTPDAGHVYVSAK